MKDIFEIEKRANGEVVLVKYTGSDAAVDVSEGVTMIDRSAFESVTSIERVVLPNSLQRINRSAFANCPNLKEVVFSGSVSKIDPFAFWNCPSLKHVDLPVGLETTCACAFGFGTTVAISEANAHYVVENGLLLTKDKTRLTRGVNVEKIVVPDGVESIGRYSFYGCKSLRELVLPSGVKRIGAFAFKGCSSLEKIALPESLRIIEPGAFTGCRALREIALPEGLFYVGERTFFDCSPELNLTVPESVAVPVETFWRRPASIVS